MENKGGFWEELGLIPMYILGLFLAVCGLIFTAFVQCKSKPWVHTKRKDLREWSQELNDGKTKKHFIDWLKEKKKR